MSKKSKEHKILTRVHLLTRQTLAENTLLLMERQFPASKFRTRSAREQALAKGAGCTWSTIQRILSQSVGAKTDTIADLAVVFGVKPADLLTPNFAHGHLGNSSDNHGDLDGLQRKSG